MALDWLRWARSMGHPSSLSGKVHKGEAITAMSILAVLCEVAPICVIETLANLAAPLSVQAFLRGEDAILVSHCLPCLAAMATGQIICTKPQSAILDTVIDTEQSQFSQAFWTRLTVLEQFPKACLHFLCVSETTLETWYVDFNPDMHLSFCVYALSRIVFIDAQTADPSSGEFMHSFHGHPARCGKRRLGASRYMAFFCLAAGYWHVGVHICHFARYWAFDPSFIQDAFLF